MFGDLSLNGTMTTVALFALVALTLGIIFYLRNRFKNSDLEALKEKYAGNEGGSVASRNKYPEVNAFDLSSTLWGYGLAIALATTVLGFSWTKYEKAVYVPDYDLSVDEEIEMEPPRTAEPPPPPPPPPPPVIEEVPEEEILEEDEPEFVDQDVEEETVIEEVVVEAPPPPPPPPPPVEDEIFKVVEQMPRFPGCEDISGGEAEKKKCAEEKMLQYIYKSLKYPAIARENGIEGRAILQFVVDKDGSVTEVNVVRDPGAGTGDAAKKVINAMNDMPTKWTPGKQRGRPVKVLYTLPVLFRLEG